MPKKDYTGTKIIKKNSKATVSNSINEMFFEQKDMTLQAFRMFVFYLAKIDPKNPNKTEVSVPLREYAKMLDVELNEKAIDRSTTKLLGYVVNIDPKDDGEFEELNNKVQIFSQSKLKRRKKDGELFLTFQCHDELKPHIFNLQSQFTKFEAWNILNLNTFQDMRMYMLLSQYRVAGERRIELDELREKLQVPEGAYPEYKIFARDVLRKCQKVLKERTDLCFEFKAIGRPANAIYFKIAKNEDYNILKYLDAPEESEQAQIPAPAPEPEQITIDNQEQPAETPQVPERKLTFAEIEQIEVADAVQHGMGSDYAFTAEDMLELATALISSGWWQESKTVFTPMFGGGDELRLLKDQEVARYVAEQYAYTRSRSKSKTKDGFKKYLVKAVRGNYAEVEVVTDPKPKAKKSSGSFNTQEFFAAAVKRSLGDDFDPEILEFFENKE